ncbi:MAG: TetR/AcrR family transcriptional regulator [Myxococcales bacterium]|nr:TetR/AcrR family transcriptional regulator [Myxococcales bacterium]
MPQTLKADVRQRIEVAAIEAFARGGYHGTTMGRIAQGAGVSTGNVYRYFRGKSELFHTVLDDAFLARFEALLDARLASLASLSTLAAPDAAALRDQSALLDFWVAHRLRVVLLLDRCTGTSLEAFGERFVQRLTDRFAAHLEARLDGPLPAHVRMVLANIFDATRRTVVSLLEHGGSDAQLRRSFAVFWSYQLAGLAGFVEGVVDG